MLGVYVSHERHSVDNTSDDDPEPAQLHHVLSQSTRRACRIFCAIWKSTVDDQRRSAVDVRYARDCQVVRDCIQIGCLVLRVASTRVVLVAETLNWLRLVPVAGPVVVRVVSMVAVCVDASQPESGKDAQCCAAEDVWRYTTS